VIMLGLMATTDTTGFARQFVHFGSYSAVIDAAKAHGFAAGSASDFGKVLAFMPLGFTLLGLAQFPAYAGGEIKAPARNMAVSMLGGLVAAGLIVALLAGLAYHTFGADFIGSMTYLAANDPADYPAGLPAPFLFLYAAMLTNNVPLLIVMSVGWLLAIFSGMFVLWVTVTRNLLAYSLDRILPDWLAEVSPTFHTPTRINALITIMAIGILALFVWGPVSLFGIQFSGALLEAIAYVFVCFAAILFAYRARELFGASPFHQRLAGIPLIALLGIGGVIQYAFFAYILATVSAIGANVPSGLIAVTVLLLIGIPVYFLSYLIQRSRGVDITMAFRELPPE
jgi:basic amino acid/polyamine antiporter, APA family